MVERSAVLFLVFDPATG